MTEAVIGDHRGPTVDTADSRTQLTLENQAVAQLPIIGRNLVTLVTMAPGLPAWERAHPEVRRRVWTTSRQKSRLTPAPTVRARITINTLSMGWT